MEVLMSTFWNYDHLERVLGGRWLTPPRDGTAPPTGLRHDTRTLRPGDIYLAVKGDTHDGHRFVDAAFEAGAAMAIVSHGAAGASPSENGQTAADSGGGPAGWRPRLLVNDTVAALQDLASAYRDELAAGGCKVLAVGGSNGKTTTRHLLHHALTSPSAGGLRGTQSPRSFNNHLGVPLTLLAALPGDDFVACEIGTNHPGEIAALGEIAWPDAAIVTSIGHEHLEFFKTLDGVAKEEAALLPFVRPGGVVVCPADAAERLMPYYDVQENVTLLPIRDADAVGEDFPLLGDHNRMNAALVLAVRRWLAPGSDLTGGVWRGLEPPAGRLHRRRFGRGARGVTVIDDTYNANPDSMRAALEVLAAQPGRRVAVLGEMRELGEASPAAHAEVRALAEQAADVVVLLGEAFGAEPWRESTPTEVAGRLEPGDTVLLKASRGMALERIIPALEQRFGR
jgi:UDP-N-acetylmuramoyl-tripeptide--D-alanyl-D-alanine ligase